jgi:hypothetical protein
VSKVKRGFAWLLVAWSIILFEYTLFSIGLAMSLADQSFTDNLSSISFHLTHIETRAPSAALHIFTCFVFSITMREKLRDKLIVLIALISVHALFNYQVIFGVF